MSFQNPLPAGIRQVVPDYVSDGSTLVYSFPFRLFAPQDLFISVKVPGASSFAALVYGYDYTVALNGVVSATATLSNAAPAGSLVRLQGRRIAQRLNSVVNDGSVQSVPLEAELDADEASLQELRRDIDANFLASLRTPDGSPIPALPSAATRANNVLAFDASGNPLAALVPSAIIAPATTSALGVVKVGSGLSVDLDGTLHALLSQPFVTPYDFQCACNGVFLTANCSITAGSGVLTVAGAAFSAGDIGKAIHVPGAGAAGGMLVTTITGVSSGTVISLFSPAATTLADSLQTVAYGTDDTANLARAVNDPRPLIISGGVIIMTSADVNYNGTGAKIVTGAGASSIILMTNAAQNGFVKTGAGSSSSLNISNLQFMSSVPKTAGACIVLAGAIANGIADVVDHIIFAGGAVNSLWQGVSITGDVIVDVSRCYFLNLSAAGVAIATTAGSEVNIHHNTFDTVLPSANGAAAINYAKGPGTQIIANNRIQNYNYGFLGIVDDSVTTLSFIICDNTFEGIGASGSIVISAGGIHARGQELIITGNRFYNAVGTAIAALVGAASNGAWWWSVVVTGNAFVWSYVGASPCVLLTIGAVAVVGGNTFYNFTATPNQIAIATGAAYPAAATIGPNAYANTSDAYNAYNGNPGVRSLDGVITAGKARFNGTSGALVSASGVTSVTRSATGTYTLNFAQSQPSPGTRCYAFAMNGAGSGYLVSETTTGAVICTANSAGALTDFSTVMVSWTS